MTLNAGINMFSAFLYQYIEFFVFLKVARRGGGAIAPLAPPLNPPLLLATMPELEVYTLI